MADSSSRASCTFRLWAQIMGPFSVGYMTSTMVHFYFENLLLDMLGFMVTCLMMMGIAFYCMEMDQQKQRKQANEERRKRPEADPLEIGDKQPTADKLTTLRRVATRAKETFGQGKFPTTPPLPIADRQAFLAAREIVVVHFWAEWNHIDRQMDQNLKSVREKWEPQVCFVSCDTDDPGNLGFAKETAVINLPFLAIYVRGERVEQITGVRSSETIDEILEDLQRRLQKASD
ncbi:thioredoxin family protein [Blastopirellula marina]|uniref:Thioredoxin domain-containing protein n=1 Tax=Blastopirellula marina TaxID=124 RepID=A0A2S8GT90_9BACT|nr:thioredoxin family protein [Blastopirellula marina]PQO47633.1 hypothetical protein C5Y93_02965 [Blastopirellula marina]